MKKAIVTGAYGNLGRAVVQSFLDAGWTVAGTLAPGEKSDPPILNDRFKAEVVNLTDEVETQAWLEKLMKEGNIEIAVLTVGGYTAGSIADTTLQTIQKMVKLNFDTAYNVARPILAHMLKSGTGRIFMIGARPALAAVSSKGMFAYGLAKTMVIRLAEMINLEARGSNVTATVFIPSTIDTPQNRASMPEANPGKWVKAEEIAELIRFYCSEAAGIVREGVVKVYGDS